MDRLRMPIQLYFVLVYLEKHKGKMKVEKLM